MPERYLLQRALRRLAPVLGGTRVALVVVACSCASSGGFESSWQSPDATPLDVDGSKVAAIVMMRGEAARRAAEDVLAAELRARGADGVPLYTILPDAGPDNEAAVRDALEDAGVAGAVVMRPVGSRQRARPAPSPTVFLGTSYSQFWGGYFGFGFGAPWTIGVRASTPREDTIVSVETLVYSLTQNQLVWAGTSRTTNPSSVERLIERTAAQAARELERRGLLEG
jgi:hypothetical protein